MAVKDAGDVCRWCNGLGWYTSYSGGFAHDAPCDHCNWRGLSKEAFAKAALADLGPHDASECPDCDGFGMSWNNADPTSGQWSPCGKCDDARGHP